MNFDKSIVEDVALEWFLLCQSYGGRVGKLGFAVGYGPHTAPETLANLRDTLLQKLLNWELSVNGLKS